MIADLKPYPSMKDSGVPFLGNIPEHWHVGTLRRRLRSFDGIKIGPFGSQLTLEQMSASGYKVYGQANVIAKDFTRGSKFISQQKFNELSACEVRQGDVLITMMGTSGRSACVPEGAAAGIMDSHLLRLRIGASMDVGFAALILDEAAYIKDQILVAGKGSIMHGLNSGIVKNLILAIPPVPEQSAIVRFLDHADRLIQSYIRSKQKLIKLLEEQKRVIVNHAVTRGLDPSVHLKPSGVEWLGDVPEHWEVSRSRRLFTARTELARPGDVQLSATQAYGVIPQAEFEEKVGRRVVKISMHLEKRRHVEKDDFVISMRSFQGGLERAWASGCIRSSYVVLKPSADVDVGFFTYLFKSYGYIRALQSTANFIRDGQDLNFGNFCLVDLPVPPLNEQKSIAESLNASTANIDASIKRTRAEIELLREYRTRLISDVVAGKLDVRDAAVNLPDVAADEDELASDAFGAEDINGEEFSDLTGEADED